MGRLSKRALGLFIFPSGVESHKVSWPFTAYRAGEYGPTYHLKMYQAVVPWAEKTYDIIQVGGSKEYFRPVLHAIILSY